MNQSSANASLVKVALESVFIKRDASAIDKLFSPTYLQHNPSIASGPDAIKAVIEGLPSAFRYEMGMVVAQGDLVMVHGRYVGWGPPPMVAVDIFRIENGRLAEHWDVMQEEVPADQTRSGTPMFTVR